MAYKLNPKLIPLLIVETDKLMAKITADTGSNIIVQFDDGVIVNVSSKDLGVKMGKSTSGKIYFDNQGNLVDTQLSEPPKEQKSVRQGCSTKPQTPQFK